MTTSLLPPPGTTDPGPDPAGRPRPSNRAAALRLAVVVASLVVVGVAAGAGDVLLVIAALILMVMVHELGHLLAAKHGGMKVTEYFLGFGPRLWSVRRGETEYGIKALPLGGYVKIPGMTNLDEVDPADEPRTYRQQPFRARLLVAVAGSAMHLVMAFVLLWTLLAVVGTPSSTQVSIGGVTRLDHAPGPAMAAGLRAGDVVVSVDGRRVSASGVALIDAVRAHAGVPISVVVERDGTRRALTVVPVNDRTVHEPGVHPPRGSAPYGVIGITLTNPTVRTSPVHALGTTVVDLGRFTGDTVGAVVHLFSPSAIASRFHQVVSAKAAAQATRNGTRVQSAYGAVQTAADAVHAGIGSLLLILVSINLFVGVFNLVPMLPLDGGHVAIAVYEKIRSRRRRTPYHADVAKLLPYTWAMVLFLGVLFGTAFLNDVLHPVGNPFG